jgi:hypothetical protein
MRIGFTNLFAYRPHVQHLKFLADICEKDGHEVFFLTCDGELDTCYTKLIRGKTGPFEQKLECIKCVAGGVRSYSGRFVDPISRYSEPNNNLPRDESNRLSLSSAATTVRVESNDELNCIDVKDIQSSLSSSIEKVYSASLNWIKQKRLDSIIVFNGRMDITAAVIKAAEAAGINYITHERTWFGDGIRVVPNNNCLSIVEIRRMAKEYSNLALSYDQSVFTARLLAARFKGTNNLEWRVYNQHSKAVSDWPAGNTLSKKYLVIPSSRNEFMGNEEFKTSWIDNTAALKDLVEIFCIEADQIVVRGHPNWSENIGKSTGKRSSDHYAAFCKKMGFTYIAAESDTSTYSLIEQADVVILNGGSSTIEAATLGKSIVCLSPSQFQDSGFVTTYTCRESMFKADGLCMEITPEMITKLAMRHVYTAARRFPMYVDQVKAISTTTYEYVGHPVSSKSITDVLITGQLEAYDTDHGGSLEGEDMLVKFLHNKEWDKVISMSCRFDRNAGDVEMVKIPRRWGIRWIDTIRSQLKRGDL